MEEEIFDGLLKVSAGWPKFFTVKNHSWILQHLASMIVAYNCPKCEGIFHVIDGHVYYFSDKITFKQCPTCTEVKLAHLLL